MFQNKVEVMAMARAMAAHASAAHSVVARNMANADTPGFVALDAPAFADVWADAGRGDLRQTRAGHMGGDGRVDLRLRVADSQPDPNGNSVSIERETFKAATILQQHDMALGIYQSLSGALRSALGRGGR
jgi:flagellar basal-body rod protein FlgB